MKYCIMVTALLFTAFGSEHASGQGCSDAGFCTIINHPAAAGDSSDLKKGKNKISIGTAYGKGDFSIDIFSSSLAYKRRMGEKFSVECKVGFQSASGELGSASAVNDGYLSFQYSRMKENHSSNILAGIKIPFHDASATYRSTYLADNISLPMPYQPGQGTWDIIGGYEHGWENFSLSAGFQLPVSHQNKNNFLPPDLAFPESPLLRYLPTNNFERKGDVLLRAKYSIQPEKSKFIFTVGILPIYHLGNDTYADSAGTRHEISGSEGLTFNMNLFIQYEMSHKSNFILSFGAPAIAREKRPDGLTRKFVVALDYNFNF